MTLAVCSQPSAIEMPGTDVSMALVAPPCSVPGLGSKVSSWLGPPAIQSRMQAICRFRSSSACRAIRSVKLTGTTPSRRQPGRAPAQRPGGTPPADHPLAVHANLHELDSIVMFAP